MRSSFFFLLTLVAAVALAGCGDNDEDIAGACYSGLSKDVKESQKIEQIKSVCSCTDSVVKANNRFNGKIVVVTKVYRDMAAGKDVDPTTVIPASDQEAIVSCAFSVLAK